MPTPACYLACAEPGCQMRTRVRLVAGRPPNDGRCPKCAAYHRGRMEARDKKLQRRRRNVGEVNAIEEKMEQRGAVLSEFLRSGR